MAARKNCGGMDDAAEAFAEFLETAVHMILFVRNIYPGGESISLAPSLASGSGVKCTLRLQTRSRACAREVSPFAGRGTKVLDGLGVHGRRACS